jgi:hypothetical protein
MNVGADLLFTTTVCLVLVELANFSKIPVSFARDVQKS